MQIDANMPNNTEILYAPFLLEKSGRTFTLNVSRSESEFDLFRGLRCALMLLLLNPGGIG